MVSGAARRGLLHDRAESSGDESMHCSFSFPLLPCAAIFLYNSNRNCQYYYYLLVLPKPTIKDKTDWQPEQKSSTRTSNRATRAEDRRTDENAAMSGEEITA